MPGLSLSATQGWLNQVALVWALSSPTLTEVIVRPGRRKGRGFDPEDFDQDRAGLAVFEIAQGLDSSIAVAMREAVEDVADGVDAGFGRGGGELGADAGEASDRDLEDAGAGPVDGGAEEVGAAQLADAGEGAHYWAASSHHQLG